ncbi:MAG: DNA polymerase IV [Clostridia bacterium]|nr:DNA polymerase IV [Clostridia bacterium]
MERVILHCDCNGFFASVEMLKNPQFKSVPMAVGGRKERRHGIILAKNELAKKYNIKTGETLGDAKRKCPELIIVPPVFSDYERISRAVNAIYAEYTDRVEPFGIDESYLDVTDSLHLFASSPKELADLIRERIKWEIGITVSVGVSFCKTFAKLGSDMKKPDGTTVISRSDFKQKVWKLPVGDMLYVGGKTAQKLEKLGIKTIGELAAADRKWLKCFFGVAGNSLCDAANGNDLSEVTLIGQREAQKSVGNGMTFPRDLRTERDIKAAVALLTDTVCVRMRGINAVCRTVCVTVKKPDLTSNSKRLTLPEPTDSFFEINGAAQKIALELCGDEAARMISVSCASLSEKNADFVQQELFSQERKEKLSKLENAVYKIKEKHGVGSIKTGSMMSDLTLEGKQPSFYKNGV